MSKRRKILLIMQDDEYSADTRARNEVKTLVEAGYEASVISPSFGGKKLAERIDGVYVYRFPCSRRAKNHLQYIGEYVYSMAAIFFLSVLVFVRRGFDVIHIHTPPDLLFFIALLYKPLGKKFIYDHHDLVPELYQASFSRTSSRILSILLLLEKLSCKFADVILTVSPSTRELETGRDSAPPEKIFLVPNGPDLLRFHSLNLYKSTAASTGKITLGFVANLSPAAGIFSLLMSLHHLAYDLKRQDFLCQIIGDGAVLGQARKRAQDLGLNSYVLFTGKLPWNEAVSLLSTADICLDPRPSNLNNYYVIPVKLLEYMALGRPIVAFDLPGSRRAAEGAAIYARPDDVQDFAAKVALLMDDPRLRESMGTAGRERAERGLSWEHSASALLKAYQKVLVDR